MASREPSAPEPLGGLAPVTSPRARASNADVAELEARSGVDQRRFARIRPSIRVELSNESDIQGFVQSHVHDISLGGMFVKTSQPRPIGTYVAFRMYFDVEKGGCEFEGTVVRVVTLMEAAESPDPNVVPGMAIEFDELSAAATGLLHHLVRGFRDPLRNGATQPA